MYAMDEEYEIADLSADKLVGGSNSGNSQLISRKRNEMRHKTCGTCKLSELASEVKLNGRTRLLTAGGL
ncbi:unnamed protein product [Ceratitis capitata]|uniref:(Mediterranean fruit fly) hypothetical protein n=1 Tax=Ceratitis capitata TaxID=7213 RepID=A0A811U614_CERCA|nr:unnamed protein product [Ceratitis capitata]